MALDSDDSRLPASDPTGAAALRRRTLWVLMLIGLAWLLVELSSLLLLAFGAVVAGVVFEALGGFFARVFRLPYRWALPVAILTVFAVLGLTGWLFGARIGTEFEQLQQALPRAWQSLQAWLGQSTIGARLLVAVQGWSPSGSGLMRNVGNVAAALVGALGGLLLVLFAGIYLAAEPAMYRDGLLRLVPARSHRRAADALRAVGNALRSWLGAQAVAMTAVGVMTSFGLWLIGLPSALALGLLAAMAEFVPVIGPIIAAVPALLIALTLGPQTVLWTLGLYLLIQQIDGNVLVPMVTRRAVALPPALSLFSIVALGLLFGPLGVLLGAPLAVVLFVLVREIHVKRMEGPSQGPPRKTDKTVS